MPLIVKGKDRPVARGILVSRTELFADPRKKELQKLFREIAQAIWARRGYYGTLELAMPERVIEWDAIFSALGIDKTVGHGQIRQAVKEFTRSAAYAGMLAALPTGRWLEEEKEDAPQWVDGTLSPYLGGYLNKHRRLRRAPQLRLLAKRAFKKKYLESRPIPDEALRRRYKRELTRLFRDAASLSWAGLVHFHKQAFWIASGAHKLKWWHTPWWDILASSLSDSKLTDENKAELLRGVLDRGLPWPTGPRYRPWSWLSQNFNAHKTMLRVFLKHLVISSPMRYMADLMADPNYVQAITSSGQDYSPFFVAVGGIKDELLGELETALGQAPSDERKYDLIMDFVDKIVDPRQGKYESSSGKNSVEMRAIKNRLIERLKPLRVSLNLKYGLFHRLTVTGASEETDRFFKEHQDAFGSPAILREVLKTRRIGGNALQLELTKKVLEPRIHRLQSRRRRPSPDELHGLVLKINEYAPRGSLEKDKFLESLALRLQLRGPALYAMVEDQKSYNWRKAHPLLVNLGSSLAPLMTKLAPATRLDFIRYLIAPEKNGFPKSVLEAIERRLRRPEGAASPAVAKRRALDIKFELEQHIMGSSPFERIPLTEFLIAGGERSLIEAHDFPYNFTRSSDDVPPLLDFPEGSTEEKQLIAFLNVIPKHEKSASLAYLLSQSGEDKASAKALFEVFQTVGIKFGQLSSTFKLFGEAVAQQTEELKNNAAPMTVAEIQRVMRGLSREERSRIRIKGILGSAGIKTAVLVEVRDQRNPKEWSEAVMLVQRPNAADQIATNLDLGALFLAELKKQGLSVNPALLDSIVDAVRRQLAQELKMSLEAKRLQEAKILYEGLNVSMAGSLNGWRFSVPELVPGFAVRDHILFIEKAEGVPFKDESLSAPDKAEAGAAIVESSLALLFRYGWFDADRHFGNQLIDAKNRVIWLFDFGQVDVFNQEAFWRTDDRYALAQFVRAIDDKNPRRIVRHGLALSGARGQRRHLERGVAAILAKDNAPPDQLVDLIHLFAEEGAPVPDRFTFGAFKGLMTLYGEGYVSEADFRRLLGREVSRLLIQKWPRFVRDGM